MEKRIGAESSGGRRRIEVSRVESRAIVVLVGAVVMAGMTAPARASNCTQIDVSGAKSTSAFGINSRGDIAGRFTDAKNAVHAFLLDYRSGQVTVIDVPGATLTHVLGINSLGDMVGRYVDGTGSHGFLLRQGQFTTVQYPGSTFTQANGINAWGDIVGRYDIGTVSHGFTLVDGVYSSVDVPGATGTNALGQTGTLAFGIDDSGDISGFSITPDGISHGFIRYGSNFAPVDAPGVLLTGVRGIAQGGHLAMGNTSTDKKLALFHGFLYESGILTPFDYPGAATTEVFGVNSRGDFVGQFNTDGGSLFHGYVCHSVVDGILPVAASVAGASGSFFHTAIELHNPYSSPISGTLTFRRQAVPGSIADPSLSYTLLPHQSLAYPDILSAIGVSGLGSLDLVAASALTPVASARVTDDRDPSGLGAGEALIGPDEALLPGMEGILLAPSDLGRYRFNIGVRTLTAGASMTIEIHDRGGDLRRSFKASYPADFFFQLSAEALLGVPLQPGDSVDFAVISGRAVIYGATADNVTGHTLITIASRSFE